MFRTLFLATLGAVISFAAMPASAQDAYPSRPVKFIVPLVVGGSTDQIARVFAVKMKDGFGQPIVVDNKVGAGTQIGTEFVAASPPDGYTILFTSSSSLMLHYTRKTKYELGLDFVPVGQIGVGNLVLITRQGFPANNLGEFFAAFKAKGAAYNFGSNGVGSQTHLAGELFKSRTGISAQHVPYKGDAELVQAVVAGQVDFAIAPISAARAHIQSGRVRAIATTGSRRDAYAPDLPTINETKLVPGGYELTFWLGAFLPAKTPAKVVERARAEFDKVMKDPEILERVKGLSLAPTTLIAAEFQKNILDDSAVWKKLIKDSSLSFE